MKKIILIVTILSISILFGCDKNKNDNSSQQKPTMAPSGTPSGGFMMDAAPVALSGKKPKVPNEVIIPEDIIKQWKSVTLEIIDKATEKKELLEVNIGEKTAIKGTSLVVKVTHFIPNFTMGKGVITSLNENIDNPAAFVEISESGKNIWKGSLFSDFPTTHAFQHNKYAIILKNFTPVAGVTPVRTSAEDGSDKVDEKK